MKTLIALLAALGLIACGSDGGGALDSGAPGAEVADAAGAKDAVVPGGGTLDAGAPDAESPDAALPDAGPATIAGHTYDPPEAWVSPIDDYLAAGEAEAGPGGSFLRGIHDLTVYEDRLYLGYGDANINLGRVTPIEFRSIADPDQPDVESEFATDDEQIDRYRIIGDHLCMAGVDATEDAWLGNIYCRGPDAEWAKYRTVHDGVHVHDLVGFGDAWYAVGSGSAEAEWSVGDIYGYLWRTTDGGETFETVHRNHNESMGDSRFVRLLPVGDQLFMFGYRSNAMGSIYDLANRAFDGETVTPLPDAHPLRFAFVNDTLPVGADAGLVHGVNAQVNPIKAALWRVEAGRPAAAVETFAERTVLDFYYHPDTGETVLLSIAGNAWPPPASDTGYELRIDVTDDLRTFETVLEFDTIDRPVSIALWRGDFYIGDEVGRISRARAK